MNNKKVKDILSKTDYVEDVIKVEFESLINKPNKTQSEKKIVKAIDKIQRDKLSQEKYMVKYKHLDILMYDVETFMPIYKGVKKWSEYENY